MFPFSFPNLFRVFFFLRGLQCRARVAPFRCVSLRFTLHWVTRGAARWRGPGRSCPYQRDRRPAASQPGPGRVRTRGRRHAAAATPPGCVRDAPASLHPLVGSIACGAEAGVGWGWGSRTQPPDAAPGRNTPEASARSTAGSCSSRASRRPREPLAAVPAGLPSSPYPPLAAPAAEVTQGLLGDAPGLARATASSSPASESRRRQAAGHVAPSDTWAFQWITCGWTSSRLSASSCVQVCPEGKPRVCVKKVQSTLL